MFDTKKLRWVFSNRVVAVDAAVDDVGYFRPRDFVKVGNELRRVRAVDNRRLVLSVY